MKAYIIKGGQIVEIPVTEEQERKLRYIARNNKDKNEQTKQS